jgi:N-acetylglucosaminyldiphosphoundecaprenol N-acetyl-beta-D-mannosaminyltransferase
MTHFMTLEFDDPDAVSWPVRLLERAADDTTPFGYVVTPNVDHVVNLLEGGIKSEAYRSSELVINDSRLLELLARVVGKKLVATPGSDIVAGIFQAPSAGSLRIAIVGPDQEDFDLLADRFPDLDLLFVPSSQRLVRGDADWTDLVRHLSEAAFDLLLVCVSFPKQEYLAFDLQQKGCVHGLAICAGASVDFLTGRQHRAPSFWQKARLEWAYRLMSNPRQMWRRYLVKGPRILVHFVREEVIARTQTE